MSESFLRPPIGAADAIAMRRGEMTRRINRIRKEAMPASLQSVLHRLPF